jgi:hypothetical protein
MPLEEEIERASIFKPTRQWVEHFANQPSLRILALGGSNTAHFNYVRLIEKMIKSTEFSTRFNPEKSYIINAGIGATGPTISRYEFEKRLPFSEWPNLITLEFSVNGVSGEFITIKLIEKLIFHINQKYHAHKLHIPNYLFIELFRLDYYYALDYSQQMDRFLYYPQGDIACPNNTEIFPHNHNTSAAVAHAMKAMHTYNRRGSEFGMNLLEYARFYRYPILSVADALFPSFLRFLDTHSTCKTWPYNGDGLHMTTIGYEILVHSIMKPFFHEQIQQYEYMKLNSKSIKKRVYDEIEFRFFPPEFYRNNNIVFESTTWGSDIEHYEHLRNNIRNNSGFKLMAVRKHDDGKHNCFGSTRKGDFIEVGAYVHRDYFKNLPNDEEIIKNMTFRLEVGILHSWDTNYVGRVECSLYTSLKDEGFVKDKLLTSIVIDGNTYNGLPVHDTIPRMVTVTKELHKGKHILSCTNLDEGKLACLVKVNVFD